MTQSPEAIERDVELQRAKVEATLTALQDRLSPGGLADQATRLLSESGGSAFAQNLGTKVRDNPMPVTLVGLGLAWLMMSNDDPRDDADDDHGRGVAHGNSQGVATRDGNGEGAVAKARELSATAGDKISATADEARAASRRYARRAKRGFFETLDEQPMLLGALGVAVGAALGGALPATRTEDELIGEASDRVKAAAAETGKEQVDKVRESVKSAVAGDR